MASGAFDPVRHAPTMPIEYAPIPVGPNDSELVAHDRHRLSDALVRGIPIARTLRIDELPDDVATVARIEVGATVEAGEVLGYVEAMGVLNDVEASCAGLVGEIAVEDGQPVEYGQPLFVLRAEDQAEPDSPAE